MKRNVYLFILLFLTNLMLSQTNNNDFITVKYRTFLLDESNDFGCFYYEDNTLITNNNESIYIETPKDTLVSSLDLGDLDNSEANYKFTYYKNFDTKQLYFDRKYGSKKNITDSINQIVWKLNDVSKKVMNYNCQEAEGYFRGRHYKAYFLKDIPYMNGPFKFDGLPGLILKVVSLDGCVNIEAYEMEISQGVKFPVKNPFNKSDFITWEEFKNFYKKRFEKVKNFQPEEGVAMSIPKGYIENFIDE